jgi:hypothetical protein
MSVFWRRGEALTYWSITKKEITADLNVLFFLGEETEFVLIKNCIACKYVEKPY